MTNPRFEPRINFVTLGVTERHSGYFSNPDGHLWEVAWNPHFELNSKGEVQLP